ncbi:MAG TPA: hypothetical protein PKV16_04795 [Caldisericia bacterium]|nr:hypothetical protein [Caldisericia bacterium]HPF48629.1 hypothetical protein [Caldisericia bacterium]HPI83711.1 hypothetical protein [Caldisericia bacterium]HPQ93084.1 hypothetical protein [Caldisericia bacterium]HRV75083.1 hypothetical protein [Caldisericia bacterium]
MIEEILLAVGFLTPITERVVEATKQLLPGVDRRIIATVAGLALAPLVWWLHGGMLIWSCLVAGALVSLPSGLLHDLLSLLQTIKDNSQKRLVLGK